MYSHFSRFSRSSGNPEVATVLWILSTCLAPSSRGCPRGSPRRTSCRGLVRGGRLKKPATSCPGPRTRCASWCPGTRAPGRRCRWAGTAWGRLSRGEGGPGPRGRDCSSPGLLLLYPHPVRVMIPRPEAPSSAMRGRAVATALDQRCHPTTTTGRPSDAGDWKLRLRPPPFVLSLTPRPRNFRPWELPLGPDLWLVVGRVPGPRISDSGLVPPWPLPKIDVNCFCLASVRFMPRPRNISTPGLLRALRSRHSASLPVKVTDAFRSDFFTLWSGCWFSRCFGCAGCGNARPPEVGQGRGVRRGGAAWFAGVIIIFIVIISVVVVEDFSVFHVADDHGTVPQTLGDRRLSASRPSDISSGTCNQSTIKARFTRTVSVPDLSPSPSKFYHCAQRWWSVRNIICLSV